MKIAHIKISNILGIQDLEFSPEGFNQIVGPNGQGKTSVLEAIKAATGQGHDATLLRKGATKGEVVLVLDDGTEIKQRVTPSTTTRDVVRDGKKVTRPGEAIKALLDTISVNPVEFLTARKQDRVKVLLESMPLELDIQRLNEISGVPIRVQTGTHALTVIEHVRQQVYDDRTGTNRAIKEKDNTINQLRGAMPDAPGGVEGDEDELRAKIDENTAAYQKEETRITNKLSSLREARDADIAAIEQQITELRLKIEQRRADFQTIESKAQQQRNLNTEKLSTANHPLNRALDAIKANRDAGAKRKATLETIAQMEQELVELRADEQRQTAAIDGIDAYKLELLQGLPIPGLEVVGGEIVREGVPFDRLNTAQKVGIAFEIARLRAGDLAVVCLDGMELLDDEHLQAMQDQAEQTGVQVFVTRVTSDEFGVRTA